MYTCIDCVLYCLYCVFVLFPLLYLFLFVLSVLVKELLPSSENSILVNNNNNNNNNVRHMKRLSLLCLPVKVSYSITSYGNIIFDLGF